VDRAEVVGRPSYHRGSERDTGEHGGSAPAPSGNPAVYTMTRYTAHIRSESRILGVLKIHAPVDAFGNDRTGNQAQRHKGEAHEQGAIADLVNFFQPPAAATGYLWNAWISGSAAGLGRAGWRRS